MSSAAGSARAYIATTGRRSGPAQRGALTAVVSATIARRLRVSVRSSLELGAAAVPYPPHSARDRCVWSSCSLSLSALLCSSRRCLRFRHRAMSASAMWSRRRGGAPGGIRHDQIAGLAEAATSRFAVAARRGAARLTPGRVSASSCAASAMAGADGRDGAGAGNPGIHDHTPHHGGVVAMAGMLHLEAKADPSGRVQLYLTDVWRRPLPLDDTSGTVTLDLPYGKRTLPLGVAGEALEAQAQPLTRPAVNAAFALQRAGSRSSSTSVCRSLAAIRARRAYRSQAASRRRTPAPPAAALHAALRQAGGRRCAGARCDALLVAQVDFGISAWRLPAAQFAVGFAPPPPVAIPVAEAAASGSAERDAGAAGWTRSGGRVGESPHPLRDGQWPGRARFRRTRRHRARAGVVAGRRRAAGVDLLYAGRLPARCRRRSCAPSLPGRARSGGGGDRPPTGQTIAVASENGPVSLFDVEVADADACVARTAADRCERWRLSAIVWWRRRRRHPAHLGSRQRRVDRRAGAGRNGARDDGRRGARPRRREPRQRSAHQIVALSRRRGHRDARLACGTDAEPGLGWRTLVSGDSGGRVALWDWCAGESDDSHAGADDAELG